MGRVALDHSSPRESGQSRDLGLYEFGFRIKCGMTSFNLEVLIL